MLKTIPRYRPAFPKCQLTRPPSSEAHHWVQWRKTEKRHRQKPITRTPLTLLHSQPISTITTPKLRPKLPPTAPLRKPSPVTRRPTPLPQQPPNPPTPTIIPSPRRPALFPTPPTPPSISPRATVPHPHQRPTPPSQSSPSPMNATHLTLPVYIIPPTQATYSPYPPLNADPRIMSRLLSTNSRTLSPRLMWGDPA